MSRVKGVSTLLVVLGFIAWAAPARAQINLSDQTLNGVIGVNTFILQASGGTPPYHYAIAPGFTPPPGFRVQDGAPLPTSFFVSPEGTGGFLGVATTPGTFTTTVRVSDATSFVDRVFTLNISPLQLSGLLPRATLNVPYSFTFTGFGGSGGSGYSWSATNLPAGMNLSPSGVLSGTPTTIPGSAAIVTLTDSTLLPPFDTIQRQVPIFVDPYAIDTPGLLPTATAGVFYTQTLSAPGCGGPCTWTPTSFAGVSLNSAGVLSGTPFLQTGSFSVTVTGSNGTVTKQFSLFVSSDSTFLQSGFQGFADTTLGNLVGASILPFGGTPPYTASLVSGTLPPGISLVASGGETVCINCGPSLPVLVGRPMQVGTYTFTLKFMDSVGGSFTPPAHTWNISPLSSQYFTLPLSGTIAAGTPYTQPLLVIGGSNSYTFLALTALPAGLSIDTNTGVISGTPTAGGRTFPQIRISEGATPKLTTSLQFNVTGPIAYTGVAVQVGLTNATLFGAAIPTGTATSAHFEWGSTTAYGNSTPTQSIGSGIDEVPLTPAGISGLTCGTTYHFRTVSTSGFGTSTGVDGVFKTAPCAPGTFKGFVYTLNGYPFTNLIYGYGVTSSGALLQLPGFPVPSGGQGLFGSGIDVATDQLAYDAVKHRLYVINFTTNTLSAFSVSPAGALTAMPFSPIDLPPGVWGGVRVHPSGSPVIVGGATTLQGGAGLVASYVVTPTTATPAAGSPYAIPGTSVSSGAFSRNGDYLYVGEAGLNGADTSMAGFSVAPATGVLTPLAGSPFTFGGMFALGFATDASGRLFAANPGQLRAFTTSSGVPSAVAGNPFAAAGLGNIKTGVLHPFGFYMVVQRGGSGGGKVGVFKISGSGATTTLTNVAGSPFSTGGFDATTLALSTDGAYLFVANQDTRNLTVFGVNGSTGALTTLSIQPADTLGNDGLLSGVAFAPSGSPVDDVDGDGKTDVAIFRPSTGTWWISQSSTNNTNYLALSWGISTDIPVSGDFDGDGKTDIAVYRPSTGTWWILRSSTNFSSYFSQPWGISTDIPVTGDFDGDGKTDIGVYRPSTGVWYILESSTNYTNYLALSWGISTDIPVPGDYDGDGKTDIAIYRPSTGTWWILKSSTSFSTYVSQAWGVGTDVPVPGDYDGDGKTDIAIYRPSTGLWYMLQSSSNNTNYLALPWGIATDTPVPGDYDGDGRTDLAIFRASTGTWWMLLSSTNYSTYVSQAWGLGTDSPLNHRP